MPLSDVDAVRRRLSTGLARNRVEFIVYVYSEDFFQERTFQSMRDLLPFLENEFDTNHQNQTHHFFWIDVINRSSTHLPNDIRTFCEFFDIHPLTMEDISTLAPYMKLDMFHNQASLYLLMKVINWTGQRIEQQQISFYLKASKNLLITFREDSNDTNPSLFQTIRHRLRREPSTNQNERLQCSRLKQLNVDYLFYSLLDDIIDRYMFVMEEIAQRISRFDEDLMSDNQCRTLGTLYAIYRLKHDLLHLRILFNPLKEIIDRLRRTSSDEHAVTITRTSPSIRVGIKHHVLRRQAKGSRPSPTNPIDSAPIPSITEKGKRKKKVSISSIYLNQYIVVYLNDLSNHIDQLLDTLDIQRESVAFLISFWVALNNDETQEILTFLMMISVLFMPCLLVTGMHSTNFENQPQYQYYHGYYILLGVLAFLIVGMLFWYRIKKWI